MRTNERALAAASADSAVVRCAAMVEHGPICGVFHAINIGPIESRRAECIVLGQEIARAIERGDHAKVLRLRAFLAQIPLETKWQADAINHVTTEGANLMLDTAFAGSSYTVVGPYMGLISSVGYSTTAITDVAAQINGTNGWKEAGSSTNFPLYTTPRKTCVWSSASAKAKALSAALSFPIITTGGTVKGCFIIFGTGALSTIADTNGKLWSAGVFSGGDKVVAVSDTLNVSYTTSM